MCKFWGTACVLTTIGVQLGAVDPRLIYLDYPLIFKKFQVSVLIQTLVRVIHSNPHSVLSRTLRTLQEATPPKKN